MGFVLIETCVRLAPLQRQSGGRGVRNGLGGHAPKSLGYQFRGYRLDPQGRPTFLYDFKSVQIADFPEPGPSGETPTLRLATPVPSPSSRALPPSSLLHD